jgi:hypothetical protein
MLCFLSSAAAVLQESVFGFFENGRSYWGIIIQIKMKLKQPNKQKLKGKKKSAKIQSSIHFVKSFGIWIPLLAFWSCNLEGG